MYILVLDNTKLFVIVAAGGALPFSSSHGWPPVVLQQVEALPMDATVAAWAPEPGSSSFLCVSTHHAGPLLFSGESVDFVCFS